MSLVAARMRACVRACVPACLPRMRACAAACVHPRTTVFSFDHTATIRLRKRAYVRVRTHDTRVNEVTSGVDARKEETKGGNRRRRGGEKERRGHGVRNLFLSGIYHSTTAPVYALLGDASVCVRRID